MTETKETIANEKIKDLKTYISKITNLHNNSGLTQETTFLWFRGQSNQKWKLEPSIYRSEYWKYLEREAVRDFELFTNKLIHREPANQLEWLFLMQHYGLPTRLLDWTESHLVALYFSVLDYSDTCDGAVWIIDPWSLNIATYGQKAIPTSSNEKLVAEYTLGDPNLVEREVSGTLPVAIRPARNSERIISQKGTFTIHGKNTKSLDKIIEEHNSNGKNKISLNKEIIDGTCKLKILKELYLAGISYSVLFPEIQGICNDIKIRYSKEFIKCE